MSQTYERGKLYGPGTEPSALVPSPWLGKEPPHWLVRLEGGPPDLVGKLVKVYRAPQVGDTIEAYRELVRCREPGESSPESVKVERHAYRVIWRPESPGRVWRRQGCGGTVEPARAAWLANRGVWWASPRELG